MATHDSTAHDAVIKDYYTKDKVLELSFYENPLFAMMPKKMAGGRRYVQPVEFGHPGNASAGFSTAMSNSSVSKYEDFLLTRVKQYQRVMVDHELLLSTGKADEAFMPAFDEFDRGFRSLGEKLARRLYRTKSGSIGQMANSAVNVLVITLADKADAFNFHIGQVLAFATNDGGGALLDAGDTTTVTAIDREGGTITVADQLDTKITGITTTSYVYPAGDYDLGVSGLENWLPVNSRATALAASFFGVTRNVDSDRLGGIYLDGTTLGGLDEVLMKLVAKVMKHGGRPTHIFLNPETFANLQLLWNSKAYVNIESQVRTSDGTLLPIGFPGMKVNIGGANVRIYGDRSCPSNRIYALQMDTWCVWHTGEIPNFLGDKFTGKILKLAESEDSLEARVGAYLQLGCRAPGWNGVAKIAVQS